MPMVQHRSRLSPPCLLREMRIACLIRCYLLLAWWLGLNCRNPTHTHHTHTVHTHTSHTPTFPPMAPPQAYTCVSPRISHHSHHSEFSWWGPGSSRNHHFSILEQGQLTLPCTPIRCAASSNRIRTFSLLCPMQMHNPGTKPRDSQELRGAEHVFSSPPTFIPS